MVSVKKSKRNTKAKTSIDKRKTIVKSRIKTIKEISDNELVIKIDTKTPIKPTESFSEAGVLDPNGIHPNPLTGQPYKNLYAHEKIDLKTTGEKVSGTYVNFAKNWSSLIVYANRIEILDCIKRNQVVLATAGTGIGKTVIIPKLALHAFDYQKTVACCIPRRIVTRDAAEFSARCMDVVIGEEIGYQYMGTSMINKNGVQTRLIYTTTGSLISRMFGTDPTLKDYSCVVVDEAHERSIQTDILLLLLKKALSMRSDLKVVIMSATIDLEVFRKYFKLPSIKFGEVHAGSATTFNIKEHWLYKRPEDWKTAAIYIVINILETTTEGDILIFVRAGGDAVVMCGLLNQLLRKLRDGYISGSEKKINPFCVKLEGSSEKEEAELAISQYKFLGTADERGDKYTRKVVISTNVAESSITIDGIVYVIECGYEFAQSYEPRGMLRSLLEHNVAQSGAIQRRGRAGRTREGECYYLYSKDDFSKFSKYPIPDIQKSDLTKYLLDFMRLEYVKNVGDLRVLLSEFISPPADSFVRNGLRMLEACGAITTTRDNGRITTMGYSLTKFRTIPVFMARSIIASYYYGCVSQVCAIAACAFEADGRISELFMPFKADKKKDREWNKREEQKHKRNMDSFRHSSGDYLSMLDMLEKFRNVMGVASVASVAGGAMDDDIGAPVEVLDYDRSDDAEAVAISNGAREKKGRQWCKEHSIRFRVIMNALRTARELEMTVKNEIKYMAKRRPAWVFENVVHNVSGWTLDKKILLALAIGNRGMMGKTSSGGAGVYESTFAEVKKMCKISQESMLRGNPANIMFYEIFATAENMKFYKMNMVSAVPDDIVKMLGSRYEPRQA